MLKKLKLPGKFTAIFFIAIILITGLCSYVFYQTARAQILEDIRHRLLDIVAISAQNIDGDSHSRLQTTGQQESAIYKNIKQQLQRTKQASSDIYNIYTMRIGPNQQIEFVVDAEDDPDKMAVMGKIYSDASPFLRKHFAALDKPMVEDTFYRDKWGYLLSGYAPFYKSNGERAGVIGIDIPADTILQYQHELRKNSVILFIFLLPIILLIGLFVSYWISRPIMEIKEAAEQISCGNYDINIPLTRSDEIGMLAAAFNMMAAKLTETNLNLKTTAQKYQNIFENALEGIFQATPDGRLLTVNSAMGKMFGFHSAEKFLTSIKESDLQFYINSDDLIRFKEQLQKNGQVTDFVIALKRANEDSFTGQINARLLTTEDGNVMIEGMMQDITERLEHERLEKERQAAEAASQAKSEFLANMSHEIRTPLNAVMGLTDLIMRTELTDKQQEYFKKIKTSSKALLAVINDILDFSKIEAGKLELEETNFSLFEVMANLTEMFSYLANDKEIELLVYIDEDVPGALRGDPVRLGQILNNLASNALKFTEHGEVVISAKLASDSPPADEQDVKIEFCVRDTGIGIPTDRISTLFNSFTQADSSITRKHGGTGLGLAIAKKITGLMGGDIHVESTFGKGSSFIFSAVFRKQAHDQETRPVAPLDLRGLHILIIDDNKTAREILYSAIASFKMIPETAKSGKEALEMITNQDPPFDLILVDWKMPNMNGLEIARYIKQKMNLPKIPKILMVTAYGRSDLLSEADCSFLDAFLYKPINQSILFDTIIGIFKDDSSTLPSFSKSRALPESESNQPNLAGGKVLLVEDNEINQEIAHEWLKSWNIEVIIANNGAEAVNLLRTENVDVVLMDMQMPIMDGYEATHKIRQELNLQQLPIIAMTAHALQGDRKKCLEAGMNDYITKPIDPQLLLAALQLWMGPVQDRILDPRQKQPQQSLAADFADIEIPGISIENGLYKVNNNQVLYKKLLKSFEKDFKDTADRITERIRQGQNDEARQIAHSIKGVSGNIGAQKLFDNARNVENAIVADQFTLDSNIWNEFSESLLEVINGIGAFLTQANQTEVILPAESSKSRIELILILEKITVLLEEDLVMARALLEDTESNLKHIIDVHTIESINQYIDDFDIDSALLLLHETIKKLEEKD